MKEITKDMIEAEEEFETMKAFADKNPEIQHLYWAGQLIQINLDKFRMLRIDNSATRYSNYYLVMKVGGRTYRVSEMVAETFVALICWARNEDMKITKFAETVLKMFVKVYESFELSKTKDEIRDGLDTVLGMCVERIVAANTLRIFTKQIKDGI